MVDLISRAQFSRKMAISDLETCVTCSKEHRTVGTMSLIPKKAKTKARQSDVHTLSIKKDKSKEKII